MRFREGLNKLGRLYERALENAIHQSGDVRTYSQSPHSLQKECSAILRESCIGQEAQLGCLGSRNLSYRGGSSASRGFHCMSPSHGSLASNLPLRKLLGLRAEAPLALKLGYCCREGMREVIRSEPRCTQVWSSSLFNLSTSHSSLPILFQ